jgi:hypothetical protein
VAHTQTKFESSGSFLLYMDALNRAVDYFHRFPSLAFALLHWKEDYLPFSSGNTTMPSTLNAWGSEPLSLKVIGHNTGTSMDGVDMVQVHFTQESPNAPLNMRLLHYKEYPMPQKVKRRVMRPIKENKTSPEEMAIVNIQLCQVVADAVNWLGQQRAST